MAGERFASAWERFDYAWKALCVNVFDFSGALAPNGAFDFDHPPQEFTLRMLLKDMASDLGFHSFGAIRRYREWYGNRKSNKTRLWDKMLRRPNGIPKRGGYLRHKTFLGELSYAAFAWRRELWRFADYNIHIQNPERFDFRQLRELRKVHMRGYDISRLEDPSLSPTDMRAGTAFLFSGQELNHDSIFDMRQDLFKDRVDGFLEEMDEAARNGTLLWQRKRSRKKEPAVVEVVAPTERKDAVPEVAEVVEEEPRRPELDSVVKEAEAVRDEQKVHLEDRTIADPVL